MEFEKPKRMISLGARVAVIHECLRPVYNNQLHTI